MAARSKTAKPSKIRSAKKSYKFQEAKIEVVTKGTGRPILLLQSEDAYETELPFINELAKKYKVIMPWAPGFGNSTLPDSVGNIDDMSYLYLDLLDQLKLKDVSVIGFSVGAWLAAEIATKDCSRIKNMVLVAPMGVKLGGKFDRDIEDIYYNQAAVVAKMKFHDPAKDPRVLTDMSDDEAFNAARHCESTVKLCWNPYFHNPSLKHRLNRITAKTLVISGANDGMTKTRYGRGYAKLIPGAKFVSIAKAGHFPHIEQSEIFMKHVRGFID
jgi:pimeloyl-ACP methyl ester carboxylesterase